MRSGAFVSRWLRRRRQCEKSGAGDARSAVLLLTVSRAQRERRKHSEAISEADRERSHEAALELARLKWSLYHVIAVGTCFLIGVGLAIPLAHILVGTTTSVTVNVAFTFSLAVTLSVAVTGTGWALAHRGRLRAEHDNRRLRRRLRELEHPLEPGEGGGPMLESKATKGV